MGNRLFRFDAVEIDVPNLRVKVDSQIRPLEPKSFRLLLLLVENPGRVLTKDEIMKVVWPDVAVSDNSLSQAVAQVRKALNDDAKSPKYIETVPSIGYRFVATLEEEPSISPFEPAGENSARPLRAKSVRLSYILLAAGLLAASILVWWIATGRGSSNPYPLHVARVTKLTSYPGDEREPAISPDGAYVAFSWSGPEGDNYDIYVVQAGGQPPLRLTQDPARDSYPAWSPDGRFIAFIRVGPGVADIILVPPLGGPEHTLHRFARFGADLDFTQNPVLAWSHDGKSILFSGQSTAGAKYQLFELSVDTGKVRALSSPDSAVSGDSSPALSADAAWLAFVRYLGPRNGRLFLQALSPGMVPLREPAELPNSALGIHSPAWIEDGKELLFADNSSIFQWDRKKGTVPIYAAGLILGGMSVGPKKGASRDVVVAGEDSNADIWSVALDAGGKRATGPPEDFIHSTEWDSHPDFSPDGRRVVFVSNRGGGPEVWIADADGRNLRQMTHLGAHVTSYPKWSPDGTRIAFHARVPDVAEAYVVDVNQGVPRRITDGSPGLALVTWSNDGKFLYASELLGGTAVSFRFPADGGPKERLWEGALVRESVDGRSVLYWKSNKPGIFRRALDGNLASNPEELLVPDFWPNNQLGGYAPVADGIYYVSGNERGKPGPFRYFDYASRKSIDVAPPAPGLERGFAISPDRRRMLFAATAEVGGDLLQLEIR